MPYGFRNHTCNLYHFAHAASLGSRTEKVKIAPMAAQIHKTCKAVGIPHISAAQPTNGVRRPPMVILKPKVTPEAKPTFLPKQGQSYRYDKECGFPSCRAVNEKVHGRYHKRNGYTHYFDKTCPIRNKAAHIGADNADGKEQG